MTEEPNERLRQFLNDGRSWERKATNIPGAFLFRLPASKGRPASLAIEINQLRHTALSQRSSLELDEISHLLSAP
jgi:hypothetical protein